MDEESASAPEDRENMSLPEDSLPEEGMGKDAGGGGAFSPEDSLAGELGAWGQGAARPDFKERCRQSFLSGDFDQSAEAEDLPDAALDPIAVEPALARALECFDSPPARGDFRRQLQDECQAVAAESRRCAELESLLAPALEIFGAAAARPTFETELRESFRAGAFEVQVDPPLAAEGGFDELEAYEPEVQDLMLRPVRRSGSASGKRKAPPRVRVGAPSSDATGDAESAQRNRWAMPLVAVLAVAAAVLLYPRFFGSTTFVQSHWVIDENTILVGASMLNDEPIQEELSPAQLDELWSAGGALSHGADAGEDLRIRFGEYFVIELEPGSRVKLPALARLVPGQAMILEGEEGHFRIATSPRFKDEAAMLRFETGELAVDCTGTVFGVDISPAGTCVCCTQGEVKIKSTCNSNGGTVTAGQTHQICPRGQGEERAMNLNHPHRQELKDLETLTLRDYWN